MHSLIEGHLAEHLDASLQAMGVNVRAYYAGSLHAYRPVAAELRKLLCDTRSRKDISLLPSCFPCIRLHHLRGSQSMIDEHTTLYIPALMSFDGRGGSDIDALFHESGEMLPIPEWLDQKLFSCDISLREFIRSIADKEGAHADLSSNATLNLTKQVRFPGDETLAAKTIVAIARYIINGAAIRAFVTAERALPGVRTQAIANGRGVHVLDLYGFCQKGIHRMPIQFVPLSEIPDTWFAQDAMSSELRSQVSSYRPDTTLILMTIDLNQRGRKVYGIGFSSSRGT